MLCNELMHPEHRNQTEEPIDLLRSSYTQANY